MNYAVNHVDVAISHKPLKFESILMCYVAYSIFFTEMPPLFFIPNVSIQIAGVARFRKYVITSPGVGALH